VPLVLCVPLLGCLQGPDPRLETPRATVETLLRANHLLPGQAGHVSSSMPTSRFGRMERASRPPPDIEAVALCFWDYDRDDPTSRAMGDFIVGMLASGQGRLEYNVGPRSAEAFVGNRPIHFIKTRRGWEIVLRDSVPEEIRNGLRRGRLVRHRLDERDMP